MTREYDAVVVGAGPAGISAAKTLQELGWRTICCDRRSFPRHKVCGEFLSPEAKRTLRTLGLLETVERLGPMHMEHAELYIGQGDPVLLPFDDAAYGISRYRLDTAWHEAAKSTGVQIATRTLVTSIRFDSGRYEVEIRQGNKHDTVVARAVIAAWGCQRPETEPLQTARKTKITYIGLKSHYAKIECRNAVELYPVPGGYVGIAPIDEATVNVAALIHSERVQAGDPVIEMLETVARGNRQLQGRLRRAEPVPASQAAVHPVVLDRQPRLWDECGHYPLVGDAGTVIPPLCGDGMSIALYTGRECAVAADSYLRGEIDLREWRIQYEQSVLRALRGPLQWGLIAHRWATHPLLIRWTGRIASLWPGISTKIVRLTRLNM